jgi:hypothetical protein
LRANNGFPESTFLDDLETKNLHYILALRQIQKLQRALADAQGWWPLCGERGHRDEGIELCRFSY